MAIWGFLLLIVGLTTVVFFRVTSLYFLNYDDTANILFNPAVLEPSWTTLAPFWTEVSSFGMYLPVTYTVWSAMGWLFGNPPNAAAFHALNLLIHLSNCVMVFGVLNFFLRKQKEDSYWPATVGTLVFALHPIQVEPVAWISATNALLVVFFGLLSAICYFRFSLDPLRKGLYAAAAFFFLAAFLSKPTAIILPAIFFLIDRFYLGRSWKSVSLSLAPWGLLVAPPLIASSLAQQVTPQLATPLWQRPMLALDTLGFYLSQVLLPYRLLLDYSRTPAAALSNTSTLAIHSTLALVVLAITWWKRRELPAIFWGVLIFVLAVAPALGLVTFRFQAFSGVADRYLYASMVGAALAIGKIFMVVRPRIAATCAFLITSFLVVQSTVQLQIWKTPFRLYLHCLRHNDESVICNAAMASFALRTGNADAAISHAAKAIAKDAGVAVVWSNYGSALYFKDKANREDALEAMRESLRIDPTSTIAKTVLERIERREDLKLTDVF